MEHGQIYPKLEDMMLKIGSLRQEYTNYIENHPEILEINDEQI